MVRFEVSGADVLARVTTRQPPRFVGREEGPARKKVLDTRPGIVVRSRRVEGPDPTGYLLHV